MSRWGRKMIVEFSYQRLDFFFPFFVFLYGALVTTALHLPALVRLAEERLPMELKRQLHLHRGLALFCLVLGSLWSLQNLWLG